MLALGRQSHHDKSGSRRYQVLSIRLHMREAPGVIDIILQPLLRAY